VDLPFPAGDPSGPPGPLARFLPPLERGMAAAALGGFGAPGGLLLDPFGASPRLVREAALAGRAMLVASNNPVTRFILRRSLQPFPLPVLQTALARLAAAPKDETRLEPFLLDLYSTTCSNCGRTVSADYFVWDREADAPVLRSYSCPHCSHTMEEPTEAPDRELALGFRERGLQHSLALEQLAPRGDPDREHAEAALSVYPARAVYAIVTVLNKLEQLEPAVREAAEALALSAMDQTNALWGHPEGRPRPLQLSASQQFREFNLWRALERAVGDWVMEGEAVPVEPWSAGTFPQPGRVSLFDGPIRTLAAGIPPGYVHRVVTVLPRPNQAYWTLSALWAAWLWGKTAAAPIKVALRRRRYDWAWHAGALRLAMRSLVPALAQGTQVLGLMPDAEPGFVAAALSGFDGAGFRLTGRALRPAEGQAVLRWEFEVRKPGPVAQGSLGRVQRSMTTALRARGEPATYPLLHAAAWFDLAAGRQLLALWEEVGEAPTGPVGEVVQAALEDRKAFRRLGKGTEPEAGHYWLVNETGAEQPLADRIEHWVVDLLSDNRPHDGAEIETAACAAWPGLLTPDRRLLLACLRSYGLWDASQQAWQLRQEDQTATREQDCAEVIELLIGLGGRLGFRVEGRNPILWQAESPGAGFLFMVEPTARLQAGQIALQAAPQPGPEALPGFFAPAVTQHPALTRLLVIPGGRASLLAEKARLDPRLRGWLEDEVQVVKFRHVRRLSSETTLGRDNLEERLALDPPSHQDPQLPLL
jgi:hypothetical protein